MGSRRRWILLVLIVGLAVAGHATASEEEIALRAQRVAMLGPVVAEATYTGGRYRAHFPTAVQDSKVAGGWRCPAESVFAPISEDDHRRRLGEITQERSEIEYAHKLEISRRIDRYYSKVFPEYQRRFDAGRITKLEQQALVRHGEAEIDALNQMPLTPANQARIAELDAQRAQIEARLVIPVEHDLADPDGFIFPMGEAGPDAAFVAALLQSLEPLISTCGTVRTVATIHYYADGFNPNWVDGLERNVITLTFEREDGQFRYKPRPAGANGYSVHNPKQNRTLSLAGFREEQLALKAASEARARRRAAYAAEYRKTHAVAEGRRPGVVYKLEPYWAQYLHFDPARRVFDGDFAFIDDVEFKVLFNLFAERYSSQCKAQVPSWVSYKIPYREYAGTDWHLDGSRTVYQRSGVMEVPIDARFDAQWGAYRPAVNVYLMQSIMRNAPSGREWLQMTVREFSEQLPGMGRRGFPEMYEMIDFFNQHDCGSAVVEQLRQNFVRAAKGSKSLQEDGILLARAESESDPVPDGDATLRVRPELQPLPPPEPDPPAQASSTRLGPAAPSPNPPAPASAAVQSSTPATPAPAAAPMAAKPTPQEAIDLMNSEMQAAQQAHQQAEQARTDSMMVKERKTSNPMTRMQLQRRFAEEQRDANERLQRQLAEIRKKYEF